MKWKAKPEHCHFNISQETDIGEDNVNELIALVRNTFEVDKIVTVEFVIVNLETLEVTTVSVTDKVPAGTEKPLTCPDWSPTPGAYLIEVTGRYDDDKTTSTKIIHHISVVP